VKKILLLAAFAAFFRMPAYSSVYIDGSALYGGLGDAKSIALFGGGIGTDVMPAFHAYAKFNAGSSSQTSGGVETSSYKLVNLFAEGEFQYRISGLPILWSSWAGLGLSKLEMWDGSLNENGKKDKDNINGLYMSISTGARYHVSQRVGVYARAGYQASKWLWQDKINDPKIAGFSVQIGVTATLFGQNAYIDEAY
jgi:hypothetical protein